MYTGFLHLHDTLRWLLLLSLLITLIKYMAGWFGHLQWKKNGSLPGHGFYLTQDLPFHDGLVL